MEITEQLEQATETAGRIESSINRVLVGQPRVVREVLLALFAGGHVLLEGMPGLGKTLLVRSLGRCLELPFGRIQFTADLMPSDVTGHAIYDMREERFRIRRGPVFTSLLLADEINRAPAKTQAALLEVMQERQISIEGKGFQLDPPFMVLATQNPVDQEGTYPLPQAELDRFLFKILLDYPGEPAEQELVRQMLSGRISDTLDVEDLAPLADRNRILEIQSLVRTLTLDDRVLDYAVRLVRESRAFPALVQGAGPRASIALCHAGRARALLEGRDFVIPDDIKAVARPVLRHRIMLSADAEIEGRDPEQLLSALLEQVEAPRQ